MKTKLIVVYRVYEVREGLLKEPENLSWGSIRRVFSDYATQDEALAAINELDSYAEFAIIPTVQRVTDSD